MEFKIRPATAIERNFILKKGPSEVSRVPWIYGYEIRGERSTAEVLVEVDIDKDPVVKGEYPLISQYDLSIDERRRRYLTFV